MEQRESSRVKPECACAPNVLLPGQLISKGHEGSSVVVVSASWTCSQPPRMRRLAPGPRIRPSHPTPQPFSPDPHTTFPLPARCPDPTRLVDPTQYIVGLLVERGERLREREAELEECREELARVRTELEEERARGRGCLAAFRRRRRRKEEPAIAKQGMGAVL